MTKKRVLRRIREKLAKVSVYNQEARRMWGAHIAEEMFHEDLDFLSTLLRLIGEAEEFE